MMPLLEANLECGATYFVPLNGKPEMLEHQTHLSHSYECMFGAAGFKMLFFEWMNECINKQALRNTRICWTSLAVSLSKFTV